MESYADLLYELLHRCEETHDSICEATPIPTKDEKASPDWVIDTQDNCIVPGHIAAKYAALSYVWRPPSNVGTQIASESLMLLPDNLDDFKQPGYLSPSNLETLHLAIQDATSLARLSDVRYLWVDSLCIIQKADTTKASVLNTYTKYTSGTHIV
jgi:hypothetical protein